MKYRIGLDMGATSIGWSVYNMDKESVIDFGVRIFDDGREDKSKASLCVKRRGARGARKLNKRNKMRMQELLSKLTEYGLFPTDEQEAQSLKLLNPYELRFKGLDEQLSLFHFGRAIFHLAQRRGFLSNRKDDKEEGGKLKKGYAELLQEMELKQARTYGEYLYKKHLENPKDNLRLKNTFDETGKFLGGLFPFRDVYKNEFDALWAKQSSFENSILTPEMKDTLKSIIFFQRPLREQEEGTCTFEPTEKRIAKAHPLFQEFRIWQTVLNLTFSESNSTEYTTLGKERLDKLINLLNNPVGQKVTKQGTINYSTIKKELGLDKNGVFNFEKMTNIDKEFEKGLLVNRTQNAINESVYFADFWQNMSDEQKSELINTLSRPQHYIEFPKGKLSIEKETEIIQNHLSQRFNLSKDASAEVLNDIALEDDFGSLSEKAISKILPFMKAGMEYSVACTEAGYHHSVKDYTVLDKLPYYGEVLSQYCLGKKENYKTIEEQFGKINNATVHVALNQVRHLVNELIYLYGKPSDISVEYARDLNAGTKERLKMSDTRDKNEVENKKAVEELNSKIGVREYNKRDIQKYKIWKNMGIAKGGKGLTERECPFSGKIISISDLMNGQMFQIEHILPFSRTLDDSLNNKVIAAVSANRYKGNRTPFEAFGESKDGYDWLAIKSHAKKLPLEQQWRFNKDAMTKFDNKEGPIARSINDTRYMTRLIQEYLRPIVDEEGKKTAQSVAGRLTAMVRKSWGLNLYKNKEEAELYRALHYHHAIDAIVIAAVSRNQIAEVSHRLKYVSKSVVEEFKDEFQKFRDPNIPKSEKADLRKRIKDFHLAKEEAIIAEYIKCPESFNISELLKQVESINISHKPKLKDLSDNNSTIGKLHEDTAYGFKGFVDANGLEANFINKGKISTNSVINYIPMFRTDVDKDDYYNAFKECFIWDRKAKTLIAKTKEEKALKAEIALKETNAIQALRNASTKAFKWFVGGGNFCAEIYEINPKNKINGLESNDQGEWKTEILSNYNATLRQRRGENPCYWKYKYPNAKRIMTLKRNDMVMGTFTREQVFDEKFIKGLQDYLRPRFNADDRLFEIDVLFRVKKISADGRVSLTPHDIAKEDKDSKSWGASSESLQRYKARKVIVSPTGKIK